MNYELARKLKDAGYPQNDGIAIVEDGTTFNVGKNDILTDEMCFVPTLEELIEACKKTHESNGYTFDFVINYVNSEEPYWFAGYEYMDGWCEGEDGQGATPAEAVANLWLALNKKVGG